MFLVVQKSIADKTNTKIICVIVFPIHDAGIIYKTNANTLKATAAIQTLG